MKLAHALTILLVALLGIVISSDAFAFDPYVQPEHHYYGPMRVTLVDTQAAVLHCLPQAVGAVECVDMRKAGEAIIYTPVTPGIGSALVVLGALNTPDAQLGHAIRHVFEGEFHPTLLPFVDLDEPRATHLDGFYRGEDVPHGACNTCLASDYGGTLCTAMWCPDVKPKSYNAGICYTSNPPVCQ